MSTFALSDTSTPNVVRYGGFWLRVVGVVIDLVILLPALIVLGEIFKDAEWMVVFGWLVAPWMYTALMWSSGKQATLGKMAVGLVVVRADGDRLSFWRATARYFAEYLSVFTFFIGFLMAGWNKRKRALHDMIVETVVIKKSALADARAALSTTKKCPDCAEVVQVEARVCRYCGHHFDEAP